MVNVYSGPAKRDWPEHGISDGQHHWWWKLSTGAVRRKLSPPTRTDLAASDWLRALFTLFDEFVPQMTHEDLPQVALALDTLAETAREPLPELLQTVGNMARLERRAEDCEMAAAEVLEIIKSPPESLNDLRAMVADLEPICE